MKKGRQRILAVVVVVAVTSLCLAAEPDRSIPSMTVDELLGTEIGAMSDRAREAQIAGRYDEAARAWIELLQRRAGEVEAIYNLACCYALMGQTARAADTIAAAWAAGFRDLEHIRTDPDLEGLRQSPQWRDLESALIADSVRRAVRSGRELLVPARGVASVRLAVPDQNPAGDDAALPLVVLLHGAGGEPGEIPGLLAGADPQHPLVVCAPRGPFLRKTSGGVGWMWFLGSGDDPQLSEAAENMVLDAIDGCLDEAAADPGRIAVMGFSQGARLAAMLAFKHPERFVALVTVGASFEPSTLPALDAAGGDLRALVMHSPGDRVAPFSGVAAWTARLTESDVPHRLVRYQGGHVLTMDVLREAAAFVADGRFGARPGAEAETPVESQKP